MSPTKNLGWIRQWRIPLPEIQGRMSIRSSLSLDKMIRIPPQSHLTPSFPDEGI